MNPTVSELAEAARRGGPAAIRAAARLMSIVSDDPGLMVDVLRASLAGPTASLPRLLAGVTGPPGSGKSTLTDAIVSELRRRHSAMRVGVVAVDPSSPFTGGAVLGDRVRMMRHATDPLVFVRSLASRGHLGGLARGVNGVVRVMALAGCEVVVLETVGVGQSEIAVAETADLVLVVLAPGQGDSVQMMKAGLLEIGDIFVVNKADRPDAARLQAHLVAMLERRERRLGNAARRDPDTCHGIGSAAPPEARADVPVLLASAVENRGVAEIVDALEQTARTRGDEWAARREEAWKDEIRLALLDEAARRVSGVLSLDGSVERKVRPVLDGTRKLEEVVDELLEEAARVKHR
ncbi:MAG: methylmalonyl Co-A mutase-associated GTPase MeaB [Vicinamibacterales bacterium]